MKAGHADQPSVAEKLAATSAQRRRELSACLFSSRVPSLSSRGA